MNLNDFVIDHWRKINVLFISLSVLAFEKATSNIKLENNTLQKTGVYESHQYFKPSELRSISVTGDKNYFSYKAGAIVTEEINKYGEFKEVDRFYPEGRRYFQETTSALYDGNRIVSKFTSVKIADNIDGTTPLMGIKIGHKKMLAQNGVVYSLD